jgi:transcriptional accessory protein Tex/SPT6
MNILLTLATELNLKEEQVEKTVALIDDGCTIPYIDTYRKMEENPEKVTIENAKKISKFLNISVNEIFFTS